MKINFFNKTKELKMNRLIILFVGLAFSLQLIAQQSPHGDQLKIDCSECHTTTGWLVNPLSSTYDHSKTGFSLLGQHQQIDCTMCHLSLNFSEARGISDCASCHLDVHEETLGKDCAFCHTSQSWIINNVSEIHANSRFPLVGPHANADCFDCHLSENLLQFRPMGVECIDCHIAEYQATMNPNHQSVGYSTDCFDCHNMRSADWNAGGFEHGFFPLTQGHSLSECSACHTSGNFEALSPDCQTCHLEDYNSTIDPPHLSSGFSVDCLDCHTTQPGWSPSTFDHDGLYFPIYSGEHEGEWNTCTDCHTVSGNFALFSCIDCHEHNKTDMDNEHDEENDYVYNSVNCLDCHPNGKADK